MRDLRSALIAVLAVLVAFAAGTPDAAAADRRVALVIGNATYRNPSLVLPNPKNDAQDVAAVLRDLDFQVIEVTDAKKPDFDKALANFTRLATGADVALFYYAGHALQYNGRNYLMPVDAELEDDVSLRYQMVSIDDIRDALGRAGGLKIIILDACRNNPVVADLARKASGATRALFATRGLARIDRGEGLVVGFATAADDVALDGSGRNSPYTQALIKRLQEPGLEVEMMFRRVAADVNAQTGGRQRPETYVSLIGEYYLNQKDRAAWEKISASNDPALLSDFIKRFPTSTNVFDARNRLRNIEDAAREKQLQAEADANRVRREEEIRKRLAALEAERAQRDADQKRQAEETARAEAAKRTEEERKRLAALELQQKAQREAEQKKADELAKAEAAKRAEEERKRLAALELQQKAQREAEQKKAAELARAEAAKRAEEERKRLAALESERKQREAEQRRAEELAKADAAKKADEERRRLAAIELQRAHEQKRADELARAETAKREEQRRAEEARAKAAEAESAKQREVEQRALAEAAKRQQVASLNAGETGDAACKRDEERLVHLRAAPIADDVLRFEREMTCAKLRPQVVRLRESVVGPRSAVATSAPAAAPTAPVTRHADMTRAAEQPSAAASAPATQNTPPAPAPRDAVASNEASCDQENEKLTRLRASRSLVEIKRFETELKCEKLRKQVLRLRESVEGR